MSSPTHRLIASPITRREALARAAAMLGVALTPSLLTRVLEAQSTPPAAGSLSASQLALVAALAERILPRTETPGAIDVGVPAFIDTMRGGYLAADDVAALDAALAHFESSAQQEHGRSFAALTGEQQDALLTATAGSPANRPHFRRIREMTLIGYFTSEDVGKNVLHYDPVPGPFQGCIPLSDVGNVSWTHSR